MFPWGNCSWQAKSEILMRYFRPCVWTKLWGCHSHDSLEFLKVTSDSRVCNSSLQINWLPGVQCVIILRGKKFKYVFFWDIIPCILYEWECVCLCAPQAKKSNKKYFPSFRRIYSRLTRKSYSGQSKTTQVLTKGEKDSRSVRDNFCKASSVAISDLLSFCFLNNLITTPSL